MKLLNQLFIILVLLSTVVLAQDAQKLDEPFENGPEPEYWGFIVELEDEPLAKIVEKKGFEINAHAFNAETLRTNLLDKHNLVREQIKNTLSRGGPGISSLDYIIEHEYFSVFNGFSLKVSDEEAQKLMEIPGIKSITPNYKVHALLQDSVPLINADDVWELADDKGEKVTGKGITIAIIDTGIGYTHPDLGGCLGEGCKVVGGYDFVNDDNDPMDDNGHGTHVASIAAGNGVLKGVAPDAKLLAYKVLNENGIGLMADVILGIERAIDPNQDGDFSDRVDIISMSLGEYCKNYDEKCGPDDPTSRAVDMAVESGAVVSVAAGNNDKYGIASPGTARKAITVGASLKSNNVAGFNSFGPVVWESGALLKPDVLAPGSGICAASARGKVIGRVCIDNNHVALSGTSMATPHVAGAAALILQKNPDWTPNKVKLALKRTAVSVDLDNDYTKQGFGRINAYGAIKLNNPQNVEIIGPEFCQDTCTVRGTANAQNFERYDLDYGFGANPYSWARIASNTKEAIEQNLGSFDTIELLNDIYTIKLNVFANGEVVEDRSLVKVFNDCLCTVKIETPSANDTIQHGNVYEIRGTVVEKDPTSIFKSYKIEIGQGYNPTRWSTTGIELSNNGKQRVKDGLLGTLDTKELTGGIYALRLVAYFSKGTEHVTIHLPVLYKFKNLPGWPKTFTTTAYYKSNIKVDDLDGDGSSETIAFIGTHLYVLDSTGNIKPGWPKNPIKEFEFNIRSSSSTNEYPIAIGDLDGDGKKEIITADMWYNNLFAWRHNGEGYLSQDGTFIKNFLPITFVGSVDSLVLEDLNNDNKVEVIISYSTAEKGYVLAWNSDGTGYLDSSGIFAEVEKNTLRDGDSYAAVGDIDGDKNPEIVVSFYDKIYAWKADGKGYLNEDGFFKKFTVILSINPPVLADLDGDGYAEIMTSYIDGLFVLKNNGNPTSQKWPLGSYYPNFITIGDIDGDNKPEIVTLTSDNNIRVFKGDGTLLQSWYEKDFAWSISRTSPVIGDIDGDGKNEIILGARSKLPFINLTGIYILEPDRTVNLAYVENTQDLNCGNSFSDYGFLPISLADVNDDGYIDLLFSCMSHEYAVPDPGGVLGGFQTHDVTIHAIDIKKIQKLPMKVADMEWPFLRRDLGNTGSYKDVPLAADLEVVSASFEPLQPRAKNEVTFTFTVRNNGPSDVSSYSYKIDFGDGKIIVMLNPEKINAGQTTNIQHTYNYKKAGIYNVKFSVTAKTVVDVDESNNEFLTTVKVIEEPKPAPIEKPKPLVADVKVVLIEHGNVNAVADKRVAIVVSVSNAGPGEVPAYTYKFDFGDGSPPVEKHVAQPLPVGKMKTLGIWHAFTKPGTYTVNFSIAPYGIKDPNMNNNKKSITVTVAPAENSDKQQKNPVRSPPRSDKNADIPLI